MPTTSSIVETIESLWSELTKTDKKVARALVTNFPIAGLETLVELSERSGVSVPSVIRCIKKMGFDSYPEFQKTLHQEIQEGWSKPKVKPKAQTIEGTDQGVSYLENIKMAIVQTFTSHQFAELQLAGKLLSNKQKRICCVGSSRASTLSSYAYSQLNQLRPNAEHLSSDPLQLSEKLADISKRDVIFAFDIQSSGTSLESFLRLARQRNSEVVLCTDSESSGAVAHANYVLVCERCSLIPPGSITTAICVIELLSCMVFDQLGFEARQRLEGISTINQGLRERSSSFDTWANALLGKL